MMVTRIGLIGLSGVGKTTYIAIIIGHLLNPLRVRVIEPIRPELLESIDFSFESGTEAFWAEGIASIVDMMLEGTPVVASEISKGLKELRVTIKVDSPEGTLTSEISFGDFSGEVFTTIVDPVLQSMIEESPPPSFKNAFLSTLERMFGPTPADPAIAKGLEIVRKFVSGMYDGIIMLLDPVNVKNVSQVRLFYLLKAVGESVSGRRIPVIVLFTKSLTYGIVNIPRDIEKRDHVQIRNIYMGLLDIAKTRFRGLCNLLYGKLVRGGEYDLISVHFYDAYLHAKDSAPAVMYDPQQKVKYIVSFAPYAPLLSLIYTLNGLDPKHIY